MAEFGPAVERLLKLEGGLAAHDDDRGGVTKYGISQRAHPTLSIEALTEAQARAIYQRDYWVPLWEKLDQAVANKLFEMAVHLGQSAAVRLTQQALRELGDREITIDGRFGPQTLQAMRLTPGPALLRAMRTTLADHYVDLIRNDPTQLAFLKGWMRRVLA